MADRFGFESLETRLLFVSTEFAVIGDYGDGSTNETAVANLVKSWNPDFITTTGDNNYPTGSAGTIDLNIGRDYHGYIYNYTGGYQPGSPTPRFFPSLGNHDWGNVSNNPNGANPYLAYFTLPGNERYYDVVQGPVHLFIIDSDTNEPDGTSATSTQGQWLQAALASSTSPHKIVVFHHAAYSSGNHGNTTRMQWPFATWGATGVLQGHDHHYERISQNGIPYFVNGLGGAQIYAINTPISGSQVQFTGQHGAMRVRADDQTIRYQFYTVDGQLRDHYNLGVSGVTFPSVSIAATDALAVEGGSNTGTFTITRTGSLASAMNVDLVISGSASNGVDYLPIPSSVTIPANQSSTTITIAPVDDVHVDPNKIVTISPAFSDDYNIAGSLQANVTIADNDVFSSTLISTSAAWRYLVTPSETANWESRGFNDSTWLIGNAPLGYGDSGMNTTLGYGGNANSRYITTYFRKTVSVANAAQVVSLGLELRRDDGAVVYLNGTEILRSNMPEATINWSTLASTTIGGSDELTYHYNIVSPAALVNGTNVIAVELHQAQVTSSDLVLDMQLRAVIDTTPPAITSAVYENSSDPLALKFVLSEDVQPFDVSDLALQNLTTAGAVAPFAAVYDQYTRTVRFHLSQNGNLIPDGHYQATLPASAVVDLGSNAAINGAPLNFSFLGGDANGDLKVNTLDFNILAGGFGMGTTLGSGNIDFTGTVDSQDFNLLIAQYGKILPPAATALAGTSLFSSQDIEDDHEVEIV